VKVYRPRQLRAMFADFTDVAVYQQQFMADERPRRLRWLSADFLQTVMGWNLVIKGRKPAS
jgi:hypothetical protein